MISKSRLNNETTFMFCFTMALQLFTCSEDAVDSSGLEGAEILYKLKTIDPMRRLNLFNLLIQ